MTNAVIFDFDDTLVYTNIIFEQAKNDFYHHMQKMQLADEKIAGILNKFDIANVKMSGGLAKDCFPKALRQTYEYYCGRQNKLVDNKQADFFENLGWHVFEKETEIIEGACDLLQRLKPNYKLFLLTQGDYELQLRRIQKSNLLSYFDHYHIVHSKTINDFDHLLQTYTIDKAQSWSVGNSLRTDILPSLTLGLNTVHIDVSCWDYEFPEDTGDLTKQNLYHNVKNLSECGDIIMGQGV